MKWLFRAPGQPHPAELVHLTLSKWDLSGFSLFQELS